MQDGGSVIVVVFEVWVSVVIQGCFFCKLELVWKGYMSFGEVGEWEMLGDLVFVCDDYCEVFVIVMVLNCGDQNLWQDWKINFQNEFVCCEEEIDCFLFV